jgi:hypothetical protein
MLARSITAQKASRVRLETGPPPLGARLTAMVLAWEFEAGQASGLRRDIILDRAARLRAELER